MSPVSWSMQAHFIVIFSHRNHEIYSYSYQFISQVITLRPSVLSKGVDFFFLHFKNRFIVFKWQLCRAATAAGLLNVPWFPETQPGFVVTSHRKVHNLTVVHRPENKRTAHIRNRKRPMTRSLWPGVSPRNHLSDGPSRKCPTEGPVTCVGTLISYCRGASIWPRLCSVASERHCWVLSCCCSIIYTLARSLYASCHCLCFLAPEYIFQTPIRYIT